MPSLGDSAFIFFLALLLFGPKKLPELARQLGKLMGEFRRASNEFRFQMEEELRVSEQAEKQKKIAALEAAAPVPPAIESSSSEAAPTTSALPEPAASTEEPASSATSYPAPDPSHAASSFQVDDDYRTPASFEDPARVTHEEPAAAAPESTPLPIAVSGDLSIMPPATGLPTPRSSSLDPLLRSVPHVDPHVDPAQATASQPAEPQPANEETLHG